MNPPPEPPAPRDLPSAGVADAFDSARPAYPAEAAEWLAGQAPARVLELGAGTGKLTGALVDLGHRVVASEPQAPLLRHLADKIPAASPLHAVAEQIPLRRRAVDVVAAGQSFHCFDSQRALPEIARVLRPGGTIALAWNTTDLRIPWVRRLAEVLGDREESPDPTHTLLSSHLFGYVDSATFRFWQPLNRERLHDLARSRSRVAAMTGTERDRLLRKADALYDEYGRGADGMLLPYVTRCFKATVRARADAPDAEPPRRSDGPEDTDALLIDFP